MVPTSVLEAFGINEKAQALPGGQGQSFLAGGVVLKPCLYEEEADWLAENFSRLMENKLRVPRPIKARDGKWTVQGWCAWGFIPGQSDKKRISGVIETGKLFHEALASLPKPGFLTLRNDPWAVADRMAWGEIPMNFHPRFMVPLNRLTGLLRPLEALPQMVHGDLIGNVLFEEGLQPGVIDFSLYWRPVGYASSIVVVDALDWGGADESVFNLAFGIKDLDQYLLRAEIFRIAVLGEFYQRGVNTFDPLENHLRTVEILSRRMSIMGGP